MITIVVYDKFFELVKLRGLYPSRVIIDSGLSRGYYSKMRNNEQKISMNAISKICEYLKVQPSDICEVISEDDYLAKKKEEEIKNLERRIEFLKSQSK